MKKLIISLCFILVAASAYAQEYELPAPPAGGDYVFFSSDKMEYDNASGLLQLLDNVTLIYSDAENGEMLFRAQNLVFNQKTSDFSTSGVAEVQTPMGSFSANDLEGNYETKDIKAKNITADFPPIRVLGAKSAEIKDGKQTYKGARVTCCGKEDPHYSIKAGHLSLSPQKKLFAYNGLLYLQDFPVFYLPVFWRSLDSQKPFTTYVDYTQGSKTGFGLLTSTVFKPFDGWKGIVNLDYYTKSGFGYGGQVVTEDKDDVRFNTEAYRINDNLEDKNRWGLRGGLWWMMRDSSEQLNKPGVIYQSQAQFRAVSDPYFNDTYFRSNPYMFMPDQDVSVALSRQSRESILRLSYLQRNIFDKQRDKFVVTERTLPKLEYQRMPFTLPGGIVSNIAADVHNTEEYDEGYRQKAHARISSSKSFKVGAFTLLPNVFYDQTVSFSDQDHNDDDAWVGRAGAGANLRTSIVTGDLDISYNYVKRFSTGSLHSDGVSEDRGEEINRFYITNYYFPTPYAYFKLGTGYSIKNDGAEWSADARMEPVLAEVGINTPQNELNVFVQNLYDIKDGNQAFVLNTNFKVYGKSRFSFGMTNYDPTPNNYTFQTRLLLVPPGKSWQADIFGDFDVSNKDHFDLFSRGIRVYKDFHDASVMLGVEDRNHNLTFSFRINVVCGGSGDRKALYARDDDYWNPWRKPGDLRD